ncbi:MAG: hypothetical protein P9L94_01255 [Candidatus Hinthialibacter antarcticus]|nr:hypothetical protein [Candidatus Hinthialibacter antarcticus]
MYERAKIHHIDEEGILVRAFTEPSFYHFEGDPEAMDSPLVDALLKYYDEAALETMTCKGFNTTSGVLYWRSELATPLSEDNMVDIGERLFLVDEFDERVFDDLAYDTIANGRVPEGWTLIAREE